MYCGGGEAHVAARRGLCAGCRSSGRPGRPTKSRRSTLAQFVCWLPPCCRGSCRHTEPTCDSLHKVQRHAAACTAAGHACRAHAAAWSRLDRTCMHGELHPHAWRLPSARMSCSGTTAAEPVLRQPGSADSLQSRPPAVSGCSHRRWHDWSRTGMARRHEVTPMPGGRIPRDDVHHFA